MNEWVGGVLFSSPDKTESVLCAARVQFNSHLGCSHKPLPSITLQRTREPQCVREPTRTNTVDRPSFPSECEQMNPLLASDTVILQPDECL